MSHKLSDFMRELEEETRHEGPDAVAEAAALDAQFKLAAEPIHIPRQRGLTQRQLSARSGRRSPIANETGDATHHRLVVGRLADHAPVRA